MNITETSNYNEPLKETGFHVLTFAETGFAMLNIYGRQFDIDEDIIEAFSNQVNERSESGSLFPKAPISAVPRWLIRDNDKADLLAEQIVDFLIANHSDIKATRLLFDFRAGVDPFVVDACRRALESPYANGVEEVVIINAN